MPQPRAKNTIRPNAPERLLMNEVEAARYLNMSVGWLRKSRMNGWREGRTAPPPFLKLGRSVKYDPRDLDSWIAANRIESREFVEV